MADETCVLEDLFSTDNLVSYNIKVAQVYSVPTAVYIQQLLNIKSKATHKNKLDENGEFTVDREYITNRTALSEKEQIDIEDKLIQCEVITKKTTLSSNQMNIDVTALTSVIASGDKQLIRNVENLAYRAPKKSKKEKNRENMMAHLKTTNEELLVAYANWIDGCYDKKGFMSVAAVTCAEQAVDTYANHNLDTALEVLRIGAINGYADITFAIKQVENNRNNTSKLSVAHQGVYTTIRK